MNAIRNERDASATALSFRRNVHNVHAYGRLRHISVRTAASPPSLSIVSSRLMVSFTSCARTRRACLTASESLCRDGQGFASGPLGAALDAIVKASS